MLEDDGGSLWIIFYFVEWESFLIFLDYRIAGIFS